MDLTDEAVLAERERIACFVEDVLGTDPARDEEAAEMLAEAFNEGHRQLSILERSRAQGLVLSRLIREGRFPPAETISSSEIRRRDIERRRTAALVLHRAFSRAEPDNPIALHPVSFMATFEEMAKDVLAPTALGSTPTRDLLPWAELIALAEGDLEDVSEGEASLIRRESAKRWLSVFRSMSTSCSPQDEWKTMETAPRDWSSILLYDPSPERDEEVFEGYYSCADGGHDCWMNARNEVVHPRMWRHHPASPSGKARRR